MFEDVIIEIPFDASILKQKWKMTKVNTPYEIGYYQDNQFTGMKFCKVGVNQTLFYTKAVCKLKKDKIVDPSYFILVYNSMISIKKVHNNCLKEVALQTNTHTILYEEDEWLMKIFPNHHLCVNKAIKKCVNDISKININFTIQDVGGDCIPPNIMDLMLRLNQWRSELYHSD